MTEFSRPSDIIRRKDRFGYREVGITHPDNSAYVRIADNGNIEIMACDGLGIILHPQNKSITMVGDSIKFMTKEDHGLRWNKLSFNSQATKFTEPAFVPYEEDEIKDIYRGTSQYFGDS